MHRIDGAGATVDNKFTEGDPVGGVQATVVTDGWLNDVQEELMSVLTAGGITPVKGAQDQVLKAIRTLSAGVIGSARNLKMSVAAASASATLTADQIFVGASLSGQVYRLTSFSKSINLATTGAGGMDTGTAPTSGYVAVYAIYNPSTGVSALLGFNSTSAVAPEVYGGENMPAGYTASALVSVWATNASKQFSIGFQKDRRISFKVIAVLSSTAVVTGASLSIASAVPYNAVRVGGFSATTNSSSSNMLIGLGGDVNFCSQSNNGSTGVGITSAFSLDVLSAQTLYYTTASNAGSPTFTIYISQYDF